MAIDPNIALQSKGLSFNLGDLLTQAAQRRDTAAQTSQRQAEVSDIQAQARQRNIAAQQAEARAKLEPTIQALVGVTDEGSYQQALGQIPNDVAATLPQHFDPALHRQVLGHLVDLDRFTKLDTNELERTHLALERDKLNKEKEPKAPEPFTLGENQVRYDPQGVQIAAGPTKTEPVAKVTYGAPKIWTVDGKPTPLRPGSDNKMYDMRGQVVTGQVGPYNQPPASAATADSALLKVEHKDPATGRTIIEYLPKSEVRGKTFEKGVGATVENRLDSAQAVTQTGNDIVAKLSDPAFAKAIGPVLGRYSSMRDFIGNPPPEYSELAGQIESYAIANMGVHGMRSVQGADEIKNLLDKKHTPESLIATIKGLQSFSAHFMENEGRAPKTAPTVTTGKQKIGRFDVEVSQ